jgi:glycosyltransferase involved in cell wall biosynthesis
VRFHWYWPFARHEELEWASATLRLGESVVVEVIDRPEAPTAGRTGGVSVVRDLPDVRRDVGRLAWLPSRAATYARRARARRATWREEHFDLVHLHYANRFTDPFARFPRPLVLSVHDVSPHVPRVGRRGERALLRRLYARPDAIVVHHRRLAEELSVEYGVAAGRVHVVPHQVFPVGEAPGVPPDGPPNLLFFGALRPNKGIEVLDEALRLLDGVDLTLTIAGRGDPRLESVAAEMARRDPRVHAEIGFATLERKRELFRDAHVAVLPYTRFASQSGVLHDAYGHGRPVVVTDVGALGASVLEDGTGIVARPDDPGSLKEAIESLLDPARWSLAAAACERVAEERSPQNTGRLLRAVYDTVL